MENGLKMSKTLKSLGLLKDLFVAFLRSTLNIRKTPGVFLVMFRVLEQIQESKLKAKTSHNVQDGEDHQVVLSFFGFLPLSFPKNRTKQTNSTADSWTPPKKKADSWNFHGCGSNPRYPKSLSKRLGW